MLVHHGLVQVAPLLDLVGKFRVLVGNPDLILQARLLVVQFTQAVFQHLRLIEGHHVC